MRISPYPLILLLPVLFGPFSAVLANESAPFGLSWGVSVEKLEASGMQLQTRPVDESGTRFATTNLPKTLNDLREVIMSFGNDNHLHKIEAVGEDFVDDLDGTRLKVRYAALSRALTTKYGKGAPHHQISEPWTRPNDFLIGIYRGSSHYYTTFASNGVTVRLEIRVRRRGISTYALIFQRKEPPRGGELLQERNVL